MSRAVPTPRTAFVEQKGCDCGGMHSSPNWSQASMQALLSPASSALSTLNPEMDHLTITCVTLVSSLDVLAEEWHQETHHRL